MNNFTFAELEDLVRRAATDAIWRRKNRPAWAVIKDRFGLGSTSATTLCVRLGLDPETGEQQTSGAA